MSIKLSYISAPAPRPYLYVTVPERLAQLAKDDPDREAFVFYDMSNRRSSITRQELFQKSTNVAKKLVTLGVSKGTTVAFVMRNSLAMLTMSLGTTLAGGIPFFMTGSLKDGSDLIETMNFLKAKVLMIDVGFDDDNWDIMRCIFPAGAVRSEIVPSLNSVFYHGEKGKDGDGGLTNIDYFISNEISSDVQLPTVQPEDPLAYFCSSGSTGKPKIVIYTHFCIINWTRDTDIDFNILEKSRFFCERTFSWVVGYPRTYLTDGTTRICIDTRMSCAGKNVDEICDMIYKEDCDVVYLPGHLTVDIGRQEKYAGKLQNVKTIILAGERFSMAAAASIKTVFPKTVRVLSYYGTTELGAGCHFDSMNFEDYEEGIIGKPMAGVEVKIVDDEGDVVPVGEQGEMLVRCVWRCVGFKDTPEIFRKVIDDSGWFHTNDIAHIREDGNIIVDGRVQEMISTGGMKYFPWTIEKKLKQYPEAANAFAVGVPDKRLKHVICACIKPKPGAQITENDVKQFCDEAFLAESTSMGLSLKPQYCVLLNDIPITSSGKIDRRTIGLIARQMLGLQSD